MSFSEVSNVSFISTIDISQWHNDGLDKLIYEPGSPSGKRYLLNLVKEVTAPIFALLNVALNLFVAGIALVGSALGFTSGPEKHVSVLARDGMKLLTFPYSIFLALIKGPGSSSPAMPSDSDPYVPNLDTSNLERSGSDIPNRTSPYLESLSPENLNEFEVEVMAVLARQDSAAESVRGESVAQVEGANQNFFDNVKKSLLESIAICRSMAQKLPEDSIFSNRNFTDKMDEIETGLAGAESCADLVQCMSKVKEFNSGLDECELRGGEKTIKYQLGRFVSRVEWSLTMQKSTEEINRADGLIA